MKRGLLFLIIIILANTVFSAETGFFGEGKVEKAAINIINYDPLPASAGEYVTLYIKVRNLDGNDISDIKVEMIEENPFIFDIDNPTRNIKSLRKDETVLLTYKVRIADDAIQGENNIRFKYITPKGEWTSDKLKINVKSESTILGVESVKSIPERVAPGDIVSLDILFKNSANTFVRDLEIKLDVNSVGIFSPVDSTTEKRIGNLGAGQSTNINYKLIVDSTAATKAYRIPLDVNYINSQGNQTSSTQYIGIIIDSKSDYQIDLEESKVYSKGDVGEVILSLSNRGTSELKFTSLVLLESDDYDIISNPRVYLGNLESDDFKTAEYKVHVKSDVDIPLKLKVDYKDSYNKPYEENKDVVLNIYSRRTAAKYGLVKSNGGMLNIVIYLIILFFLYKIYKQWKEDKDLEVAVKKTIKKTFKNIWAKIFTLFGIFSKKR